MRSRRIDGFLRLLLCGSLGCNQLNGGQRTLVELDVFSGRPNPRWELDERRSQELVQLQGRLTPTPQAAPEPPGLGYRGFVYLDATGPVRAYRGYVKTARAVLFDSTFSVERYLLDQMPAEYGPLRERIATELTRSK